MDEENLIDLGSRLNIMAPVANLNEVPLKKSQLMLRKHKELSEHKKIGKLLELYQTSQFGDAEKLALQITKELPADQFSWKVLGAIFMRTGRKFEAVNANRIAVSLVSKDSVAHYNLANSLKSQHNFREAKLSYERAIALNPNFASAYFNLGNTLRKLNRPEEAIVKYRQAIVLNQELNGPLTNLGNTLLELGRLEEACSAYIQAIDLDQNIAENYANFSQAIMNLRFHAENRKFYLPLVQLLTKGHFARPSSLAPSIVSLVKHDSRIKKILSKTTPVSSFSEAIYNIKTLDEVRLLHQLMRVCPVSDLEIENLFVAMRRFILMNLNEFQASAELIYFLSTLCLHCFTNDYIYFETHEEVLVVDKLENELAKITHRSGQLAAIRVLCFASYRPLHKYKWCRELRSLKDLSIIGLRLIEEPFTEISMAANFASVGKISDGVSRKVRAQYEKNPYPRWVKLSISTKAKSISEVCDDLGLRLQYESIKAVVSPAVLIAGCGTGQHPIETASRFSDCQVTAIDLSLASLAYAKRKSGEIGLNNLKFLHGDILNLDCVGHKFDIIESVGVLHHLEEPMAGWRVLVDLLTPDGLLKIGLYSELARGDIVRARKKIASLGLGSSSTELRNFRESLIRAKYNNQIRLDTFADFYSLSEFRDLVFHEQEQRFNLLQINNCLDKLGLRFCGFEHSDDAALRFEEYYGSEADFSDLSLWHRFEENNSGTFRAMYVFWCQKR